MGYGPKKTESQVKKSDYYCNLYFFLGFLLYNGEIY